MRISLGALGDVNQYGNVYSTFVDMRSAFGANIRCFKPNPDFAVTIKNVPVTNSVRTNEIVNTGVQYTAPATPVSNPQESTPALPLKPDGTYSFSTTVPDVYTYQVTVCPSTETTAYLTSFFTVTVLDATVTINPPVANVYYASIQTSVTTPGNVVANDSWGNTGGALNTPRIITTPVHGTASINPATGKLVCTPAANYFGLDPLTYQICELPGGRCVLAQVILTVPDAGTSTVSIVDDYKSTAQNNDVGDNVLTNDEGTGLTVFNSGAVTVPGRGTLVVTSTGSHTFTPVTDATRPVNFTYTACDNSATTVCGTAALYLVVIPTPNLTPIIYARPYWVDGATNITVVIYVMEVDNVVTTKPVVVYITKDPVCTLTFPATATSVGNRPGQNGAWIFDNTDQNFYKLTTKANQVVSAGNLLSIGLKDTVTPGSTAVTPTISSAIIGSSGGEVRAINDTD